VSNEIAGFVLSLEIVINTNPPDIFKGLGRNRNRGKKGGEKRGKKPQTNFKERGEKRELRISKYHKKRN
jgi:hypothetical protein